LGRIPEATIQEIRDRADIVSLIGRHVELKQAGRSWKGLCPFHDEKTPSFNVSPDRGIFHCFGCEKGGDIIAFLMEYEKLTFPESVRSIAGELGIEVPEADGSDRGVGEGLLQALEIAQKCFRQGLRSREGELGRSYLAKRGLEEDVIERFGLGFVPDRWDTLVKALRDAGVKGDVAEAAGLVLRSDRGGFYDRLRGRVTFPIQDVRGRVIAFGGRALLPDQEPKYLNTSESQVFHKRRTFYGFPHALEPVRRTERAVICEGYFDAIALNRAGVGEALATCGTALTPEHASQLRRRTGQVILLFDGDKAGQKAMERALEILLPSDLRVRAVTLPDGQDPDDFLTASGADALREVLDKAPDALELVIRRAMSAGCSTPAEKADAVRHVAPLVAAISNPVERSEFTRRLAVATGTDGQAVEAVVRASHKGQGVPAQQDVAIAVSRPRRQTPDDRHLRLLALIFSRHPGLATADLCERMQELLPESIWKRLIFQLLDAAEDGCIDKDDAVDALAVEPRLPEEELTAFRDIAVDDSLLHGDRPPEDVLVDVLDHFEGRIRKTRQEELKRRLQDPSEDPLELLRERQALLEKKRAATGVALGPTAH
jgi:DNA primase